MIQPFIFSYIITANCWTEHRLDSPFSYGNHNSILGSLWFIYLFIFPPELHVSCRSCVYFFFRYKVLVLAWSSYGKKKKTLRKQNIMNMTRWVFMVLHMTETLNHFLKSVCLWKTYHMFRTKFSTFLAVGIGLEGIEDKCSPRLVSFKITRTPIKSAFSHMPRLSSLSSNSESVRAGKQLHRGPSLQPAILSDMSRAQSWHAAGALQLFSLT